MGQWFLGAMMLAALSAAAQEPKIIYIEPAAVAPGKTTRLLLHGDNVQTNWSLWTSFACEAAEDQITVPASTPVGVGAVRAITPGGVSGYHLLMIDDLPTLKEAGSNQTVAAAQEITPPVAIDGACNEVAYDYFAFHARRNQEFSIEAVAQRLGSQADPVVRILDEKGRERAYCDDGPGVGRDSRLIFKAPAAGRYFVEVRDINYQGGQQYRYRLRIGSFPLLTAPYPPVIPKGRTSEVSFAGAKAIKILPADDAVAIPLSVRGKAGSGFTSVLVGDADQALEQEPNDTLEQAAAICRAVSGRFDKPKDRDLYRFEAEKDQRLVIAARTRSLGSACDVLLNILKADGSTLVEANVTGADEGTITNTFREAGTYYVELQELTQAAAPDFVYRLTIEPLNPGFVLFTEQDRFEPTKEGHFALKVSCARRQYEGPITLTLCQSEEFAIEDHVIAEKKNETVLKLKPKDALPKCSLVHVRIKGKGSVGEAAVSTRPALRKQFPNLPILPAELDGALALLVP